MSTRTKRGSKRAGKDEASIVQRMQNANATIEAVSGKAPAHIAQSIARSRADYWQQISGVVAESASYAADIVQRTLRDMQASGELKPVPGLKDMTTIMAILVDKGAVIDQTLATLGQNKGDGIGDLEKRIALLMAAQVEMQRRARDAEPVDVTPEADDDR